MRTAVAFALLATTASANFTTSYFLPKWNFGTNRLRFVASVINASDNLATLSVDLDNDPDYSTFFQKDQGTWTVGSTMFAFSTPALIRPYETTDGGYAYSYKCDIPVPAPSAACTVSQGPYLVLPACQTGRRIYSLFQSEKLITQLWSFSDTDSAGVETIVHTVPAYSSRPKPEWCGTETDLRNISVPSSALVKTLEQPKSNFHAYQFVITAGEEKLSSATTGAVASTGSLAPTGTKETGTGAGSPGAAPVKTMAPALAGLGAAVAMFL